MKVAILLSGGVDSSVALRRLRQQGYDVEAFYLKIWLEDEVARITTSGCPWQEDIDYTRSVCKQAGVKLHIVPMQTAYYKQVVEHCVSEIKKGRTPNPDVFCNSRIKFGAFLSYLNSADGEDFEKVASGHYAQTRIVDNITHLQATPDLVKDQTYFLANLKSKTLERLLFPIGDLHKTQVRDLALRMELPNAERKDSQGICFLGKFKYDDFLEHYLGKKPGDLIEAETGNKVGEHNGYWYFTIGQRHGIRLSSGPWYVTGKNIEQNLVYVSKKYLDVGTGQLNKTRYEFDVVDCNWYAGAPEECYVKVRHSPSRAKCKLTLNSHEVYGYRVVLEKADRGLSPGQFAVFYREDGLCLGSGVIK